MSSASVLALCRSRYPLGLGGRSGGAIRARPAFPRLLVEWLEDRTLPSFLAPVDYTTGANPRSAVVGDFNGDGIPDLAVVNGDSNTASVFLGKGDGTFQAGLTSPVGTNPLSAAVGDFNGDGKLDLVVADYNAGGPVQLLLGNGDGTFQPAENVFSDPSFTPLAVAVGSLEKNGKLDLVITGQVSSSTSSSGEVVVLTGSGNGTFAGPDFLPVGVFPNSVVLGDFNNDGNLDAAVTDSASGTVDVLLGRGDGTFRPPLSFATGAAADTTIADYYLAAGDFNGDGKLDIVAANRGSNNVSVLLGNGDGTFQPAVTYAVGGPGPQSVAVGDFNQDGKLDIVAANVDGDTINVLLGNGDGTFSTALTYTTGAGANSLAVGDFNGDHIPDLAVTNWIARTLSILRGTVPTGQTWLDRVYHDLLNRPVDPVGQSGWTGLLNQGVSRQMIVGMIEQSVEYRTDEVDALYQQLLNRNADPQGLNGFVNALGSGATILQVEAAIAGSPEFFQDAGGTNQGFVTALYSDLLHRAPDPGGQGLILNALANGVSRQAVAAAVLSSDEFHNDLVHSLYAEFLQRLVDPLGFQLMMQALRNGYSEEGLVAVLVGSDEYFASSTD